MGALACSAETGEEENNIDAEELTKTLQLPASGNATFSFNATNATDVVLTVDCRPPADPDSVGPAFRLSAPTLGVSASEPPRAGYYRRAGRVAAGKHTLTFTSLHGSASCTIRTSSISQGATCRAWNEARSVNTNHTHFAVGTDTSSDWEAFPASGNHWGAWAKWSTVYDRPVKRGFVLHNLEHGGVVFSYKCSSATASADCRDAKAQMVALANAFGQPRVIVTPDPTQPTKFAVRGWRYAYTSDCLDTASALSFARSHYRHGREDEDADPPIPYDPTTTNVPCQDLMSAPDSCN